MDRLARYIRDKEAARVDASTKVVCPICGRMAKAGELKEVFWCECQDTVEKAFYAANPRAFRDDVWGKMLGAGFLGDEPVGEVTALRGVGGHETYVQISFDFKLKLSKEQMETTEWEVVSWLKELE